jgi:hypothetical protein
MKKFFSALLVSFLCASMVNAACGDTQDHYSESSPPQCAHTGASTAVTLTKTVTWGRIFWTDGYTRTNVVVSDTGQAGAAGFFSKTCTMCWPRFDTPYFEERPPYAYWIQKTYPATINMSTDTCTVATTPSSEHRQSHRCSSGGGMCFDSAPLIAESSSKQPEPLLTEPSCCNDFERFDCINGGGEWNNFSCTCLSPIVIDVAGNGFDLTNAANGVMFDLNALGRAEQVSWTAFDSDDAWLVLDRNDNGVIDSGRELFGSATAQPYLTPGETKHGFRALAVFDKAENGGDGNGQIDERDGVFSNLELWRDANHNGKSEPGELQSLANSVIRVIELAYKDARRRDANGNWFRYRAKVADAQGAQVGRWAWDVFLQMTP